MPPLRLFHKTSIELRKIFEALCLSFHKNYHKQQKKKIKSKNIHWKLNCWQVARSLNKVYIFYLIFFLFHFICKYFFMINFHENTKKKKKTVRAPNECNKLIVAHSASRYLFYK